MIVHSKKDNGYTMIDNNVLRDKKLSLKATGLLVKMLSLPPDWAFSERGLAAYFTIGKTELNTALKELAVNGYLVRIQQRDGAGRITGYDWTVREVPLIAKQLRAGNPDMEKPDVDIPVQENQQQYITKGINSKETKELTNALYEREGRKPNEDESQQALANFWRIKDILAEHKIVASEKDVFHVCDEVDINIILASINYAVRVGKAHWSYIKTVAMTGGPKQGNAARCDNRMGTSKKWKTIQHNELPLEGSSYYQAILEMLAEEE